MGDWDQPEPSLPLDEAQEEIDEWMGDADHGWDGPEFADADPGEMDRRVRHHLANVLLYRKGRAQRKLDRYEQAADAQRRMVEAFLQRVRPPWVRRIAEADNTLRQIMEAEYREDPKTKTVNLPNGRLTWREAPVASLVVDDEDTAVAWLKAHGIKATRPKEVVAKDELKKLAKPAPRGPAPEAEPGKDWFNATIDGEIVPGCHLERQAGPTIKAHPA